MNSDPRYRETNSGAPDLFNLMAKELVSLAGCNDSSIYQQCIKVQVNMDVILDEAINKVALPDGTIVTRTDCDDGRVEENGKGCAHFSNAPDHTASIYMSYSLEDSATRR